MTKLITVYIINAYVYIQHLFIGILPLINKNMLCNVLCPIYKAVYYKMLLSENVYIVVDHTTGQPNLSNANTVYFHKISIATGQHFITGGLANYHCKFHMRLFYISMPLFTP